MKNNTDYQLVEYHIEYFDKDEIKPNLNKKEGDLMLMNNPDDQRNGYFVWDGEKWVALITWDSD